MIVFEWYYIIKGGFNMIPALNKTELDKIVAKNYDKDESRIVGLMMARYSGENKPYIDNNYLYWHKQTGKNFDIFWPGYGKYVFNSNKTLDFEENKDGVYFDIDAYINVNNTLKNAIKNYRPTDGGPVLILLNYRDGSLDYSKALIIKLVHKNNTNPYAVQQTVNAINELVYKHHDIRDVYFQYKVISENTRNNLSISKIEIASLVISLLGFIPR